MPWLLIVQIINAVASVVVVIALGFVLWCQWRIDRLKGKRGDVQTHSSRVVEVDSEFDERLGPVLKHIEEN